MSAHTSSQSLTPTHVSTDIPSPPPILQAATSIPLLSATATSTSLLTHLQNLLDFTSTLLALFFASVLTIFFVYWSVIYVLRRVGIIHSHSHAQSQSHLGEMIKGLRSEKGKGQGEKGENKQVNFAPHPSDRAFSATIQDMKRRASGGESSLSSEAILSEISHDTLILTSRSAVEKTRSASESVVGGKNEMERDGDRERDILGKIGRASGYEALGEATGRKGEDIRAEADLQFQRGLQEFGGG